MVLKTAHVDKEEFKSTLDRIVVNIETRIANGKPHGPESPASETIFTGTITGGKEAFIFSDSDDGADESDSNSNAPRSIYAAWKVPVCILRPRMRMIRPTVVVTASAGLKPQVVPELNTKTGGYLQSGLPSGINLLESFSGDPALNGVKPRLSALRVSRVAPVTKQQDLVTRLRSLPQIQLPVSAVVHARIRFSHPRTAPQTSTIIGQLEFDFTPDVECEVLLDKIELSTASGTVTSLTDSAGLKLPLSCVPNDHIALLYEIKPHKLDSALSSATNGTLAISVSSSVQVIPGVCTPRLDMSWSAALDFTSPAAAAAAAATAKPTSIAQPPESGGIKRAHRPAQLSIAGSNTAAAIPASNNSNSNSNSNTKPSGTQAAIMPLKSPSTTHPDALPGLEAAASQAAETVVPELGITMSFATPSEPVYPGDTFAWTVYVLNRSSDTTNNKPARKLALVAILKRRRHHESRPVRPPSTATRRREGEKEIADASISDNVLHAMQKNSLVEGADVVCLSADTRVGPLGPGACHVVELQFLALREGVAEVEAIRVVDLGSQEHVDIRDLPTTIVEPRPS